MKMTETEKVAKINWLLAEAQNCEILGCKESADAFRDEAAQIYVTLKVRP